MTTVTVNPSDWVAMGARRTPDAVCLTRSDGTDLTFATIAAEVAALAGALEYHGLGPRDRVVALGTDSVEYLELVLASMRIGATTVPVNVRLTAAEVAQVVALVRPTAFVADVRYRALVPAGIRLRAGFDGPLSSAPSVRQLIAGSTRTVERGHTRDEDILAIGLTSGTTGTPKAVLQSQRMLKAIATNNTIQTGLTPNDRLYSGAPLFHVAGLGNALCGLARGASSVLLPQFDAERVLELLRQGRVSFAVLMPTMLSSMLAHPQARQFSYPGLRGIMYGGAAMPVSLLRDVATTFGCGLYNGFGAGTEAGGQAMLMPEDHERAFAGDARLLTSIGRPMVGVELRVCDPDGREVPDGDVGEIVGRSDAVMSGYLDEPDQTAQRLRDGWFHGGDLGWRDAEGYLYLAGRVDDAFTRGGENIFPAEIERVLAEHPAVGEVVVAGAPDRHWGHVVAAFVVLRAGEQLSLDDARAFCRDRLAPFKLPETLHVLDALPRNAIGKVVRRKLLRDTVVGV